MTANFSNVSKSDRLVEYPDDKQAMLVKTDKLTTICNYAKDTPKTCKATLLCENKGAYSENALKFAKNGEGWVADIILQVDITIKETGERKTFFYRTVFTTTCKNAKEAEGRFIKTASELQKTTEYIINRSSNKSKSETDTDIITYIESFSSDLTRGSKKEEPSGTPKQLSKEQLKIIEKEVKSRVIKAKRVGNESFFDAKDFYKYLKLPPNEQSDPIKAMNNMSKYIYINKNNTRSEELEDLVSDILRKIPDLTQSLIKNGNPLFRKGTDWMRFLIKSQLKPTFFTKITTKFLRLSSSYRTALDEINKTIIGCSAELIKNPKLPERSSSKTDSYRTAIGLAAISDRDLYESKKYSKEEIAFKKEWGQVAAAGRKNKTQSAEDELQLFSGDKRPWTCLRGQEEQNKTYSVVPNQFSATSELALPETTKENANLHNIYYSFGSDGHLSITTGVINSKKKADQYVAALVHARQEQILKYPEQKNKPFRIVMHQLNGFFHERNLINDEHIFSSYIEKEVKEKLKIESGEPLICHTNRTIDASTEKHLAAVTGNEVEAHTMNVEALATQFLWMLKDRSKNVEITEKLREYLNNIRTCNYNILNQRLRLEELIKKLQAEKKNSKKNAIKITPLLKQIDDQKKMLLNLKQGPSFSNNQLKSLLQETCKAFQDDKETLNVPGLMLITTILSNQLGMTTAKFPALSPAQEVGMHLLLDHILGAASQINCKSGLDRTGFARSLAVALEQFRSTDGSMDIKAAYEFLKDYEGNVIEMDKAVEFAKRDAKKQGETFDFGTWITTGKGRGYLEVAKFQAKVWEELNLVALPITARSSEYEGVKWHHQKTGLTADFEKNPHPLPYLPMYVFDTGNEKWIQIVQTAANKRRVTAEGNILLMGLSGERSS